MNFLEEGKREKLFYHGLIHSLSETLEGFLKEKGYDGNKNEVLNLYRLPSQERLRLMEEQVKQSESDEKKFVPFGVEQCSDCFNKFLSSYNIGHVSQFFMNKNGWIEITICCWNFKNFREDRKISEKNKFQKQMEQLRKIGITLNERRNDVRIPFTQSNAMILREQIKKLGGKHLQISFEEDNKDNLFIKEVSFKIRPEALLEYLPEEQKNFIEDDKNCEFLTEDEVEYIKKLISEISHAVETINDMPSLLQTCGGVIESQIYSLCKIIGTETAISKRYYEKIKKERETNQKIMGLREKLKENSRNVAIGETFKEISDEIDRWARINLSFSVSDAKMDRYGNLSIQLSYLTEDFLDEGLLSREDLKNKFKYTIFPGSEDEIYMVGCDQNKDKINKMITEQFPGSEISEWNYVKRADVMAIQSFKTYLCW